MVEFKKKKGEICMADKQKMQADIALFHQTYDKALKRPPEKEQKYASLLVRDNFFDIALSRDKDLFFEYKAHADKLEDVQAKKVDNLITIDIAYDLALETHGLSFTETKPINGNTGIIFGKKNAQFTYENMDEIKPIAIGIAISDIENIYQAFGKNSPKDVADLRMYLEYQTAIANSDGVLKNSKIKTAQKKMESLLKSNSNLAEFVKASLIIEAVIGVKNQVAPLYPNLKNVLELDKLAEHLQTDGFNMLRKKIESKSLSILQLECVKLYTENYNIFKNAHSGSKAKFQDLICKGLDVNGKSHIVPISNNIEKLVTINNIANAVHENWKQRITNNGTYKPVWKKVSDPTFIRQTIETKKLPASIRITEYGVEQDIANTPYNELCLDFKVDMFQMATIACEVVNKNTEQNISQIIHNEYLNKYPWAKGTKLDQEFENIIDGYQIGNLVREQMEIEKEEQDSKNK